LSDAARHVPFEGAHNLRDIGGYRVTGGGRVRRRLVYRSDALSPLTANDLVGFEALGVRTVFDLRGDEERLEEPNPMPSRHCPLGVALSAEERPDLATLRTVVDGERWLHAEYQHRLTNGASAIGTVLRGLCEPDGLPALFHCVGGKDRTGLVAAVLLSWLGVDRETVLDDYELSAQLRTIATEQAFFEILVARGMAAEAVTGFLGAPRWVMADTLAKIDRDHGGIEAFLLGPAALPHDDLDTLRALLIEP
jgi:protein-tyrosine phosphatase